LSIPSEHAVNQLRRQLKAASTRPFKARGSFMQRCPACLLAPHACLCGWQPALQTRVGFCLIMHSLEPLKPTNTGRLIAETVADTFAFVWSRTETDPALLNLLADPAWQPMVVFPAEYASTEQQVLTAVPITPGRRPLLIVLDATWTQARKMFRKSPWLAGLPVLSLHPEQLSRYRLRRSAREEHLCTVEVAAACIGLAGEQQAAGLLGDYFDIFTDAYLASKLRIPVDLSLPARQRLASHFGRDLSDVRPVPVAPPPAPDGAADK